MPAEITLLLTLSVIIWSAPFIAKAIHLPTTPIEIVLGSVLASFGFITYHEYFDIISEVGFLYLMFLAGMEVDLKQIINSPRAVIQKAMIFMVALGFWAVASGIIFDFKPIVILSLPLVSIGLLASLSKSYGKDEEWIKLAFIVGVLGEIASIATLTILDAVSHVGFGLELFIKIGYLFLFMLSIYVIYRALHLLFWWYPELKSVLDAQARYPRPRYQTSYITIFYIHLYYASPSPRASSWYIHRRSCHIGIFPPRKTPRGEDV